MIIAPACSLGDKLEAANVLGLTSCLRTASRSRMIGFAIAAIIGLAVLAPSTAHASGCTDSWTNTSGGSWFTAGNWSKGVPTSTTEACITAAGTYTVTMTQTAAVKVKSLTVGGTSGGQTLVVGSSCSANAVLTAGAGGITIGALGAITLTNGEGCGTEATLAVTTGTLTNSGTIAIEKAVGGARTIEANLTNASTGKLLVNTNTSFNKSSATLQNSGAINIATGVTFSAVAAQTIDNETGGTITATGTGVLEQTTGTFNQGEGKTSGTVILDDLALNYTGTGASTIKLRGASALSGNVAAEQLLFLESTCSEHAIVTAAGSFTNSSTIDLTNGDGCADNVTLAVSAGTLSNAGTITSEPGVGGARAIEGNLTNTGKLLINSATAYDFAGALLKNEGAITIAKGVTLSTVNSETIDNETGGTITATGLLEQTTGTFNQGAGKTSGTVILDDVALNYTGTGASTIKLRGASTLSGNVAAKQFLFLESTCSEHAVVTAAGSFTNSGTINLTNADGCADNVTLGLTGGTLVNKGTINSLNPVGGSRTVEGNLKNEKTVSLGAGETLNVTGSYTQNAKGTLKVAIAGTSNFGALAITGPATLAGKLALTHTFVGKAGNSFAILASSSRTGTFSKETGGLIGTAGLYYKPTYSATEVTLVVTQATLVLAPETGLPGSSVTVSGKGYVPGDTIKLTFTDASSVKTVLPSTKANGSGEISTKITVPSGAAKGAAKVNAKSTETGVSITKTFTVT
jgi:fibronectin-binding autotransporter adhesin